MEEWTLSWTILRPMNMDILNQLGDNIAGVYRLSYKTEDGNYYVFYIGQSSDLKSLLKNHLSPTEENEAIRQYVSNGKCFFRYARVTQEYIRDAAERQLFKHFRPSGNKIEPEGREDVKVNLN